MPALTSAGSVVCLVLRPCLAVGKLCMDLRAPEGSTGEESFHQSPAGLSEASYLENAFLFVSPDDAASNMCRLLSSHWRA